MHCPTLFNATYVLQRQASLLELSLFLEIKRVLIAKQVKKEVLDLPGGSVAKTLCSQCRGSRV